MSETTLTVADGMVVKFEYVLKLDDGEVVDSSLGQEPLEFLQGEGQIVPGLERAIQGLSVGDQLDVTVAPEDAYGEVDSEAFESVSREAFPEELDLAVGLNLQVSDAAGEVYDAFVAEIHDDEVVLDFNHPLAGETLYFSVRIVDVRPATAEELEHGHVHDDHGHNHDN